MKRNLHMLLCLDMSQHLPCTHQPGWLFTFSPGLKHSIFEAYRHASAKTINVQSRQWHLAPVTLQIINQRLFLQHPTLSTLDKIKAEIICRLVTKLYVALGCSLCRIADASAYHRLFMNITSSQLLKLLHSWNDFSEFSEGVHYCTTALCTAALPSPAVLTRQ